METRPQPCIVPILSYLLIFIIVNLLIPLSLMVEFHGIFCRPFLPSVLTIEAVGGMGGGVGQGGAGGGKNHPLGHSMTEQP